MLLSSVAVCGMSSCAYLTASLEFVPSGRSLVHRVCASLTLLDVARSFSKVVIQMSPEQMYRWYCLRVSVAPSPCQTLVLSDLRIFANWNSEFPWFILCEPHFLMLVWLYPFPLLWLVCFSCMFFCLIAFSPLYIFSSFYSLFIFCGYFLFKYVLPVPNLPFCFWYALLCMSFTF